MLFYSPSIWDCLRDTPLSCARILTLPHCFLAGNSSVLFHLETLNTAVVEQRRVLILLQRQLIHFQAEHQVITWICPVKDDKYSNILAAPIESVAMSKYLSGPMIFESTMLTSLQSSKLGCLQGQLRRLNFHRQRAISRITTSPYIFSEDEKHTIVCNYRLWDDSPLQLALALEYAPTSLVDPTIKPRRDITAETVHQEIDRLTMPGNLYHYIWDFRDPDRWHMAPHAERDYLACKLLARYENLFRQGRDNFLGLRSIDGLQICGNALLSGRQIL